MRKNHSLLLAGLLAFGSGMMQGSGYSGNYARTNIKSGSPIFILRKHTKQTYAQQKRAAKKRRNKRR